MSRPVRVAIENDYAVVVAGIAAMLVPFRERVVVEELDSGLPVSKPVDILLYDTFGRMQADDSRVVKSANGMARRVVAFSWNADPGLISRAVERGVAGYIAKSATPDEIVSALERIHDGELVVQVGEGAQAQSRGFEGAWPGQEHGLTDRESEILALITQGYSNTEIAERVFLGINTVKTHIRKLYRKIGATRRAEAVLWGIDHGFRPDVERHVRTRT